MGKADDDLKAAFAGESQANRKYLAFAAQADKDGFKQVAKLFRAAAEAETVHALNHLRTMGGVKTTVDNIKAAIEGETYEYSKMYPEFIADAKKENNKAAEKTFGSANAVEKVHAGLYENALKAVSTKKDLPAKTISVCPICGMTIEGDLPDKCPICGAKKELFKKID